MSPASHTIAFNRYHMSRVPCLFSGFSVTKYVFRGRKIKPRRRTHLFVCLFVCSFVRLSLFFCFFASFFVNEQKTTWARLNHLNPDRPRIQPYTRRRRFFGQPCNPRQQPQPQPQPQLQPRPRSRRSNNPCTAPCAPTWTPRCETTANGPKTDIPKWWTRPPPSTSTCPPPNRLPARLLPTIDVGGVHHLRLGARRRPTVAVAGLAPGIGLGITNRAALYAPRYSTTTTMPTATTNNPTEWYCWQQWDHHAESIDNGRTHTKGKQPQTKAKKKGKGRGGKNV